MKQKKTNYLFMTSVNTLITYARTESKSNICQEWKSGDARNCVPTVLHIPAKKNVINNYIYRQWEEPHYIHSTILRTSTNS